MLRRRASWLAAGFGGAWQHRQECLCHIDPAFDEWKGDVAQTLLSVLLGTARGRNASSQTLDDHGDALSAADARGGQTETLLAAAQLVEQSDDQARSGGCERMAEGDGAAVDVELLRVHAELL